LAERFIPDPVNKETFIPDPVNKETFVPDPVENKIIKSPLSSGITDAVDAGIINIGTGAITLGTSAVDLLAGTDFTSKVNKY
jgi:hypothetical protein